MKLIIGLYFTGIVGCATSNDPDFVKDGKRLSNNEHCTKPYKVSVYNGEATRYYNCRKTNPLMGEECVEQEWTYENEYDYHDHNHKAVYWTGSVVEVTEDLNCLPTPKIFP